VAIVDAIMHVETGGKCHLRGASGEGGCLQFLPSTWRLYSLEVYGEVKEMTPDRERYVATRMIERWIDEGLSVERIALRWNAGGATKCGRGYNKHGVWYDSCKYQAHVLSTYQRIMN
jgi:hypothetical protein